MVYKKEIIDKFDILDSKEGKKYLEYIRKMILTKIIPEIYKDLRSQIPNLLVELKQDFDNNYSSYSSLYTKFPEWECKEIIIKTLKFLRETEIDYFTNYTFSGDIIDKFHEKIFKQRLKENVFRDGCIFIHKLVDSEIIFEEFDKMSKRKLKESEIDLNNYRTILLSGGYEAANKLIRDFKLRISEKYNENYTGICEKTGKPILNKLAMLSEKRAFELRNNVYKNDVLVYNEFEDISSEKISSKLSQELRLEFIKKFKVGIRYTLRDIKFLISLVYNSLGILKTPKATDILEYFEVRECLVTDKETKKRSKGYEILKIKE